MTEQRGAVTVVYPGKRFGVAASQTSEQLTIGAVVAVGGHCCVYDGWGALLFERRWNNSARGGIRPQEPLDAVTSAIESWPTSLADLSVQRDRK